MSISEEFLVSIKEEFSFILRARVLVQKFSKTCQNLTFARMYEPLSSFSSVKGLFNISDYVQYLGHSKRLMPDFFHQYNPTAGQLFHKYQAYKIIHPILCENATSGKLRALESSELL